MRVVTFAQVVSNIRRDKSPIEHNLVIGTYVVVEAGHAYATKCIEEYGFLPDENAEFAALYRPVHLIGMELGISVASVGLRGEPTGVCTAFRSDVVAVAKRPLAAQEMLDGEGGFCCWGRQMGAAESMAMGALPLGLAEDVRLVRDVAAGEVVRWEDVALEEGDGGAAIRREMEAAFEPC